MEIAKAVITAAGRAQRSLPLQSLVDRDGQSKTALAIIIEEALTAGVRQVGVVIAPGDHDAFLAAAGPHASKLQFIEQSHAGGFGQAVLSARDFIGPNPFLLLVGDHLYVSNSDRPCARQLVEVAAAQRCAVSAVQGTHESKLPFYGAVGGRRLQTPESLYEITEVIEKPTPTDAEQHLLVPGLRAGHYLCFFGMHVLTPLVMELLAKTAPLGPNLQLSPALAALARRERYLAFETRGRRFDIGVRYGLLHAQLALALAGRDRDEVLHLLIELLASRERDRLA
ncbi:MAG: UTP--glucose-1-phosphate uridylyltransferase [Verrucomicrobiae bacterium]|nr:UTP--glucose-1-phosphate uridylyltransferase [Verrucomicrobiae bacterium]